MKIYIQAKEEKVRRGEEETSYLLFQSREKVWKESSRATARTFSRFIPLSVCLIVSSLSLGFVHKAPTPHHDRRIYPEGNGHGLALLLQAKIEFRIIPLQFTDVVHPAVFWPSKKGRK